MPRTSWTHTNFSRGELSSRMAGRTEYEAWQRSAQTLTNWIVLLEGGLTKRPGTRYIATAGVPSSAVRLAPFIFRNVDALILEFGHQYLRFYKNTAVVGAPYQLSTPYAAADVFDLRLQQKNDVVYITHTNYAPRKLQRLADDNWQLSTVNSYPPPTYEAGRQPGFSLTLSAVSGSSVTCTASNPVFLASDVDREITAGTGRAIITAYTSTTVVTVNIIDAFASVTLAVETWTLTASPQARLKPSDTGPASSSITLDLLKEQPAATNLVTNGTFSGLTGWTNLSAPTLVSGTHDGGNNVTELRDSTANFLLSGVVSGLTVRNTTDGNTSSVNVPFTTVCTLTNISGGTENDFDNGDAYTISKTGSAVAAEGGAVLSGGVYGIGWIEQSVVTADDMWYLATFDVSGAPMGFQVGNASQGSDVRVENSYPVGEMHKVPFEAVDASSFLGFRNNQNTFSTVKNVSCRIYSIDGWRSDDVGKYVYVHGGICQITSVVSARRVTAIVVEELTSDAEAAAGSWTLESPSWSAENGYPGISTFFQQRWLPASSPMFPQTIWGSASNGDFENFARLQQDDAAFQYTLAEAQGLLLWMLPTSKALVIGAENKEIRLTGTGGGAILSTQVPEIDPLGTSESAAVEPLYIGNSIVFAQRQGTGLEELTLTDQITQAETQELNDLSKHLFETDRLTQMAYHPQPIPMIWGTRSDGRLIGLTYRKRDRIIAFTQHTLGGSGIAESVAIIPHPTRNSYQVWLVVRRTIQGGTTRYIEVFDDTAVGVDACRVYSGSATTTLTGLSHLNGETVRIAGIPSTGTHYATFLPQLVSGGQITLPNAVTAAYVGLGWDAEGETLSPEVPGAVTLQLAKKHWVQVVVRVLNTSEGLSVQQAVESSYSAPKPIVVRDGTDRLDDGVIPKTGDYAVTNLGWDKKASLRFVHDQPLPCTMLFIGGWLEVGDGP